MYSFKGTGLNNNRQRPIYYQVSSPWGTHHNLLSEVPTHIVKRAEKLLSNMYWITVEFAWRCWAIHFTITEHAPLSSSAIAQSLSEINYMIKLQKLFMPTGLIFATLHFIQRSITYRVETGDSNPEHGLAP